MVPHLILCAVVVPHLILCAVVVPHLTLCAVVVPHLTLCAGHSEGDARGEAGPHVVPGVLAEQSHQHQTPLDRLCTDALADPLKHREPRCSHKH